MTIASTLAPPSLAIERHTLGNGLKVVLHRDPSIPLVAVNLWYHTGSKNERRGKTGFAHLFEHMLFQGSANVAANEHFRLIQSVGGVANGSTWFDRTNYYETLPAASLELGLWLESDRMGFLLPGMTSEKLETQRQVVMNERRQRVDNQPYGRAGERVYELLFPAEHPYSWPVIGTMEDIAAATLDDVREFFATWYVPDNAVLTLAGDFEPDQAMELVERYFAEIPRGRARPVPPDFPSRTTGERHEVVTDRVKLERLYLAYVVPAYGTREWYAADLLTQIFAGGKASRLYRDLVHERELAQSINCYALPTEATGSFHVVATARPGTSLEQLGRAVDEHLAAAAAAPASAEEIERVKNRILTGYFSELQTLDRRADLLSQFTTYFDRPEDVAAEIATYQDLEAAEIQALASRLNQHDRVRLWVEPATEAPPRRPNRGWASGVNDFDRSRAPVPGPAESFRFPAFSHRRLASGLDTYVLEERRTPLVSMRLLLPLSGADDPPQRPGLASFTAGLLEDGTTSRSSQQIAEEIESLGGSLGSGAGWSSSVVSARVLSRDFDAGLALLADVALNPAFADLEVERQRRDRLAEWLRRRDQAGALAEESFAATLYGDSPYGHSLLGDRASLRAIRRDEVVDLWSARRTARGSTLLVVGDVDVARVEEAAQRALAGLGSLAPPPAPRLEAPPRRRRVVVIDRPGAAQTELRIGHWGPPRPHPDRSALALVNTILGGKFTSRINLNLRERHGYTYGASSAFVDRRGPGPFLVGTAVRNDVAAAAASEILTEIARLRSEPVADDEIADGVRYLRGVFPYGMQSLGGILGRLEELAVFSLPDDYFARHFAELETVDAARLARVACEHLRPDDAAVIAVGPAAELEAAFERFGAVEVAPATPAAA